MAGKHGENTGKMTRNIFIILSMLILTSCAGARTVGNTETHYLEPSKCEGIGVIERDGACFKQIIISSKSDASVTVEKKDFKIIVDNAGQPSFAHDLASTVQAISLRKAMDED